MIIIACVDDNLGLLFNNRRQSRDGILIKDVLDFIDNKMLWINTYSKQLFPEQENIIVSEKFIDEAGEGDFCFIENIPTLFRIFGILLFQSAKIENYYPMCKKTFGKGGDSKQSPPHHRTKIFRTCNRASSRRVRLPAENSGKTYRCLSSAG